MAPRRAANAKSLVWYSPSAFKAAGLAVPSTWAGQMDLSDEIAAGGKTPWCGGISSGAATGWPATDSLEEIVLRNSGPGVVRRLGEPQDQVRLAARLSR